MKCTKKEYQDAADYFQAKADAALKQVKSVMPSAPDAEKKANNNLRLESKMAYIAEAALRRCAEYLP